MTELPASMLRLTDGSALPGAEVTGSTGVIGSDGSRPTITPFYVAKIVSNMRIPSSRILIAALISRS